MGDSRLLLTTYTHGSPYSEDSIFEIRQVDGVTYSQESQESRWAIDETGGETGLELGLGQDALQAALSGTLALGDMSLEEVVGADWRQMYRITGTVPTDPDDVQIVILVDPANMLIQEFQQISIASGGELGKPKHQPTSLKVRFSNFNEPVAILAPQLMPAPGTTLDSGAAPASEPVFKHDPEFAAGPELELLSQSFQRWNDLSSFRVNINAVMRAEGEVVTVRADLEQAKNGRVRMNLDLDMGATTSMEIIVDEPDIYLRTDDQGWMRLSGEYWGGMGSTAWPAMGANPDLLANPFDLDEVPWHSITVRSLGQEEVNGAVAEHLSLEIELEAFWQELGDQWQQQFSEGMMMSGERTDAAWQLMSQGLDIRTFEVWIDSSGYTRKALIDIGFEVPGFVGSTTLDLEMNLSDFGEDIAIALPTRYEEFPSLFGYDPY